MSSTGAHFPPNAADFERVGRGDGCSGIFDQLPQTSPNVGCWFGQGTFLGTRSKGRDAPKSVIRRIAAATHFA
jgi:hypothetical protein